MKNYLATRSGSSLVVSTPHILFPQSGAAGKNEEGGRRGGGKEGASVKRSRKSKKMADLCELVVFFELVHSNDCDGLIN